jgi:hypothetical protein
MLAAARRPASGAQRIRPSPAHRITAAGSFAPVEPDGDDFADEPAISRSSSSASCTWYARRAFERILIQTQRGLPRH